MGFLDRILGRKKGPEPEVLFDSDIKKMDVRHGCFVWFMDRDTRKEFCGDFSIRKVVIDLPEQELAKKIEAKTIEGLVKLPLRQVLENLGNRHKFFKFIYFKDAVHVRVFGVPGGDVELTFGPAVGKGRSKGSSAVHEGAEDGPMKMERSEERP